MEEVKTNWGRIFGGFLLLALLYLIRWALNVWKNEELGEIQWNVIRPEAYKISNTLSGDSVGTWDQASGDMADDAQEENLEDDLWEVVADEPTGETP